MKRGQSLWGLGRFLGLKQEVSAAMALSNIGGMAAFSIFGLGVAPILRPIEYPTNNDFFYELDHHTRRLGLVMLLGE